ncbi:MAG: hypothetical protein LAT52_13190 [Balneolales bacterium]|nr:hypothetical protein [Balneolales bacterium]
MKTTIGFKVVLLTSLMVWALNLNAQEMPEIDQAQTFTLHTSSGNSIGRTATQVRKAMGTPTQETEEHFGDVGFGLLITLTYGVSELQFYEDFGFRYHYVEIKDQSIFARVNGVDIRVGDLADELAEHFPKSWAVKQSDPNPETKGYLSIEVSEVEFIDILISSNGVIQSVIYWMRLT